MGGVAAHRVGGSFECGWYCPLVVSSQRSEDGSRGAFGRLLAAVTISNLGDGVAVIAYPWLASTLTRNPLLISLMAVATRSAWLLFPIAAGGVVDRVDRKRLIVRVLVVQFALTAVVAGAVFAGRDGLFGPGTLPQVRMPGLWLGLLYVAAFLLSLAEVLRDIGAQALLPRLVDPSRLERANSRLFASEVVAGSLAGEPLGGVLIGLALFVPFGVDAVSFGVAALLIASIAGRYSPAERVVSTSRFRDELRDGVSWLWHHPVLRAMSLALGTFNLFSGMAFATGVLFVQEVLGLNAAQFGLLATGAAVAGVAGSALAERVIKALGRGEVIVAAALGTVLSYVAIGTTSSGVVVWAAMAVSAFLAMVWSVLSRSLRQRLVPDALLGRVAGAHRTLNLGAVPIGSALGGALVTILDGPLGRQTALRVPYLLAAVGLLIAIPFLRTRLSSHRIDSALNTGEQPDG